ncbi:hypothetical protein [Azonexus sp.]|jgi:hypothetical protein|uniref:hypothetical protein n=1 Tax=Azonexus sp. TaxID=1872668 RepID=UPI0028376128|nr:hypothetical protein [Azonexus sp.]MDR1995630.1 hypothetical protein [Azonexus sp.]
MFFDTHKKLLGPLHSLLKTPFGFTAGESIAIKLQHCLQTREDFEDLLALGCLFDEANQVCRTSLVSLRTRLEDEVSFVIPLETDLSPVCRNDFRGEIPRVLGIDVARYLCHTSVQCQLERLCDLFELRRSGTQNPVEVRECAEVLKLLMLSEALALSLAGVATIKHNKGQFDLTVRSSMARDALRSTWFARMADQNSRVGTLALANQLASKGAERLEDVEILTERLLDQDLSIPWRKMSAVGRALRSVEQIYAAAGAVALLAVLGIRGKAPRMSGPELGRHGLDFSTIAGLINRQADALVTDQFIMRRGDLLNIRIESASKGLRQLFHVLATEFDERDALRLHVGGRFYEQTHIRHRIEQGDDYRQRYRIFDGFDRYKVVGGASNECDVEFIIQDLAQEHYYFIQAKHALLGEKAFLEAVIEATQKDIGKGLHQLREAKRLLDNNLLDDTLKAKGIDNATPANCSFVLLHNIAQFDFQYSNDGISLYDWATFRNLLKDGECRYGHSDGPSELVRLPTPLIATHPKIVIQRLLSEHPAYRQTYIDPWATERATMHYEILGRMIHIRGLGI